MKYRENLKNSELVRDRNYDRIMDSFALGAALSLTVSFTDTVIVSTRTIGRRM